MKKLVKSAITAAETGSYLTYTRSGKRFGVHMFNDDPMRPKFQISEIHPYDDAEYAWARCGYNGTCYVEFFKGRKLIDAMQCPYYDEEYYENESEYIDELIDRTCVELFHYNKDVEPHIMQN